MGKFTNNSITNKGRILLADVQTGAVFIPTRIVMGSGNLPNGSTAAAATNVISPVKTLDINKFERTPDGKVIFGGAYSNADIASDFYFRELGLYAKVAYLADNGTVASESAEVLYCYGNAGNDADLYPAYATSTVIEKQINLVTWVGGNTEISLTIESGLSVPRQDFDAHAARHKTGGADPVAPGDIGALAIDGSVPMQAALPLNGGKGKLDASEIHVELISLDDAANYRALLVRKGSAAALKDALALLEMIGGDGGTYRLYGEHNKPTASDVGAAPAYTYGTEDLVAGTSKLETGKLYIVYE